MLQPNTLAKKELAPNKKDAYDEAIRAQLESNRHRLEYAQHERKAELFITAELAEHARQHRRTCKLTGLREDVKAEEVAHALHHLLCLRVAPPPTHQYKILQHPLEAIHRSDGTWDYRMCTAMVPHLTHPPPQPPPTQRRQQQGQQQAYQHEETQQLPSLSELMAAGWRDVDSPGSLIDPDLLAVQHSVQQCRVVLELPHAQRTDLELEKRIQAAQQVPDVQHVPLQATVFVTFMDYRFLDMLLGPHHAGERFMPGRSKWHREVELPLPHLAAPGLGVVIMDNVPKETLNRVNGDLEVCSRLASLTLANRLAADDLAASIAAQLPAAPDVPGASLKLSGPSPDILSTWWRSSQQTRVIERPRQTQTKVVPKENDRQLRGRRGQPPPPPPPPPPLVVTDAASLELPNDAAVMSINPWRAQLSITLPPNTSTAACTSGRREWVKLLVPFHALREKAQVRPLESCVMVPVPVEPPTPLPNCAPRHPHPHGDVVGRAAREAGGTQPGASGRLVGGGGVPRAAKPVGLNSGRRVQRFEVLLPLRHPPEVYKEVALHLQNAELKQRKFLLHTAHLQQPGHFDKSDATVPMSGSQNYVITGWWPLGSARANDQMRWARGTDWTRQQSNAFAGWSAAQGAASVLKLELWQHGDSSQGACQLLWWMAQCGLLASPFGSPLTLPGTAGALTFTNLEWPPRAELPEWRCCPASGLELPMLLEQRIAAALPFRVAYALLSLTSCWLLPWELVSQPLLDMLAEAKPHHAECALLRCHVLGKPLTARVLPQLSSLVQAEAWGRAHSLLPVEVHATNCSLTYRVLFTPTRRVLLPPELELSNRVLRDFAEHREHFLRVTFGSETGDQIMLTTTRKANSKARQAGDPWAQDLLNRMGGVMLGGIDLLGRHHDLLAFSSNQLRSASAWFMAPFQHSTKGRIDCEMVRYFIGDFANFTNRAKLAARLGQAFSCTYSALLEYKVPEGAQATDSSQQQAGTTPYHSLPPTCPPTPQVLELQLPSEPSASSTHFLLPPSRDEPSSASALVLAPGPAMPRGPVETATALTACTPGLGLGSTSSSDLRASYRPLLSVQPSPGLSIASRSPLGASPTPSLCVTLPPHYLSHLVPASTAAAQQVQAMQRMPSIPRTIAPLVVRPALSQPTLTATSTYAPPLASSISYQPHTIPVHSYSNGNVSGLEQQQAVDEAPSWGVREDVLDEDLASLIAEDSMYSAASMGQPSPSPSPAPSQAAWSTMGRGGMPSSSGASGVFTPYIAERPPVKGSTQLAEQSSGTRSYFSAPHFARRPRAGVARSGHHQLEDLPRGTQCAMQIKDRVIIDLEDHEGRDKYIVTDGVGRMGMQVAADIMAGLGRAGERPLAAQVRYQGCKGMLVPWPEDSHFSDNQRGMNPRLIQVRPSMNKFESTHTAVEVCNVASFIPGFINRQIIILLLALGDGIQGNGNGQIFMTRAQEMVAELDAMLEDRVAASRTLRSLGCLENHLARMMQAALLAGIDTHEPLMHRLLSHVRVHSLQLLRAKHRIKLHHSAFLFGVIDETGILGENEVFLQVQRPGEEPFVVEGSWVMVTKNPCLHPGDIRVLRGTKRKELMHLVNVVVFPINVERPHANTIAGSDLDGDQYFCCWDSQVLPMDQDREWPTTAEPACYEGLLEDSVTKNLMADPVRHLVDMFKEFQVHDSLGMIANAWVALADQHPLGARAQGCLRLSDKHSMAVDYAKTCVPIPLEEHERPKAYPHYMENANKLSIQSHTILGKIYDWASFVSSHVARPRAHPHRLTEEQLRAAASAAVTRPDPRLVLANEPGWAQELQWAVALCKEYNVELVKLLNKYGCMVEEELLTGWVIDTVNIHKQKKMDLRQQLLLEVGVVRRRFLRTFSSLPAPGSSQASTWPSLVNPSASTSPSLDILDEAAKEAVTLGVGAAGGLTLDDLVREAGAEQEAGSTAGVEASGLGSYRQRRNAARVAAALAGKQPVDRGLVVRASAWYTAAYDPQYHPAAVAAEREAALQQAREANQGAAPAPCGNGAGLQDRGIYGWQSQAPCAGFTARATRGGRGGSAPGGPGRGNSTSASRFALLANPSALEEEEDGMGEEGSSVKAAGDPGASSGDDGDGEVQSGAGVACPDGLRGATPITGSSRLAALTAANPSGMRLLSFGWLTMDILLKWLVEQGRLDVTKSVSIPQLAQAPPHNHHAQQSSQSSAAHNALQLPPAAPQTRAPVPVPATAVSLQPQQGSRQSEGLSAGLTSHQGAGGAEPVAAALPPQPSCTAPQPGALMGFKWADMLDEEEEEELANPTVSNEAQLPQAPCTSPQQQAGDNCIDPAPECAVSGASGAGRGRGRGKRGRGRGKGKGR